MNINDLKSLNWNMSGIYMIKCLVNDHCYIGQSINIRKRLWEHIYSLNKQYNSNGEFADNEHLCKAWKKYGENNFTYQILELCSEKLLDDREIYWISIYDSFNNGYNMTTGGQAAHTKTEWTDEERKFLSDIKNPKQVLQIDFTGNIIKEYWSVAQAGKINNFDTRGIYSCCNKGMSKSSNGYIWCYKEDYENGNFNLEYYLDKKEKKAIEQYDLDGNFIKLWEHGCMVKDAGFNPSTINSCCNHKSLSVNGFIWKFKDDDSRIINKEYCDEVKRKLKSVEQKYILQFDFRGNLIKTYESIRATSKDGFSKNLVSQCCRHLRLQYKNYIWRFEDDIEDIKYEKCQEIEELQKEQRKPRRRYIKQYDLNHNFIKEWKGFKEVQESGYNKANVQAVCNKTALTYKNYIWEYGDEF